MTDSGIAPGQLAIDTSNFTFALSQGDDRLAALSGLKLFLDVAAIAVRSEIEAPGSVLRPSRPPDHIGLRPSRPADHWGLRPSRPR